jgi:hypothetical protein
MKIIEHTTDIAAPLDAVWEVLVDVDAYPAWNPFLAIDRAPTAVGEGIVVTVRPGRRTMTFRPTVITFETGREISWLGRFLLPRICDGTHTLALEPLPDGHTRFRQREVFRGLLVPLMRSMFRDTDAGFAAMNAALAARVEAQQATAAATNGG